MFIQLWFGLQLNLIAQTNTLAPPPINFIREIVWAEGKRFEVTFDGQTPRIREMGDKEPSYPFIIKAPNKAYWFKINKGHPWLAFHMIEGDVNFLASVINKAMGGGPPSEPPNKGGNGNGDRGGNDEDPIPPFKVNDLVTIKDRPDLGIGQVREIIFVKKFHTHGFYWAVTAIFNTQEGLITYAAKASRFRLVVS